MIQKSAAGFEHCRTTTATIKKLNKQTKKAGHIINPHNIMIIVTTEYHAIKC